MNQVEKAICEVLKTILERDITTLQDFKIEYLKELIQFINYEFFENDTIETWEDAIESIEKYLKFQNLDQRLDFDLQELESQSLTGMISAFIQIFAIMVIFKPNEWENVINFINYQEKKLIFEILNPILVNISQELKKFKRASSFQDGVFLPKNQELKIAMQNMEIKEKSLIIKQQEIDQLKTKVFKLEADNQNLNEVLDNREKEIKEIQSLKDEALRQLEEQVSFSISKEDYLLNQRKVLQQRNYIRELKHELDYKKNELSDRDNLILQLKQNEEFYIKKKLEFDELVSVTSYYKEQIETLKQQNEVQKSKLKIQEKKIDQLEQIQIEHKKCQDYQNQFNSKIQGLKHENKILIKKFETEQKQKNWFKSNSFQNIEQNSYNEKLVGELEQENQEMKAQIQTMMDLCVEDQQQLLISQNPLSLQNLEISEIKNSFVVRRTTKRKQMDLLSIDNKRFSKFSNKPVVILPKIQILQQKKEQKKIIQIDDPEEVCQMFYTVCMQTMQLQSNELKKSLFVPNKENRTRDIFQRFTLKNILNNRQLISLYNGNKKYSQKNRLL